MASVHPNANHNPNAGKRHGKPWDPRRSTNYAHSNLLRMGIADYKKVTVTIDPSRASVPAGTRPKVKVEPLAVIKGEKSPKRRKK